MTATVTPLATATNRCGCRIIGNGLAADPLRIYWCEHHSVINDIRDTAPLAKDARAMHESAKDRETIVGTQFLRAIVLEIADALPSIVGPSGSRTAGWAMLIPHVQTSDIGGRFGLVIDDTGALHSIRPGRESELSPTILEGRSPAWAVESFGLHAILDALADALDAALGQKKAAEKIEKRVAVMHAVLTLLRGSK